MSNQSIFARGALTLSLAGAATLATSAVAGANVVAGPVLTKTVRPAASQTTGKRPYLVRSRRPFVNQASLLVLGGGATLPAIAYGGITAALGAQPAVSPSAGSVLGYFNTHAPVPVLGSSALSWTTSYCQTGSGFGKGVLNGSNPEPLPCPALGTSAVSGTNAFDATGELDTADFAGSDAPASQAEYSTLVTHYPQRGEFVQIPFVAGSVAIAYSNSDVVGSYIKLTIPEICKIADGEITDWSAIPKAADPNAVGLPSTASPVAPVDPVKNPGFPAKTIHFTYRSDNSGTTFSFTNFLSAKTGTSPTHCTGTSETWGLNQSYKAALPQASVTTNFVGASGNSGVVNAINGLDGSIGYAEAANANAAALTHVNFAKIFTAAINSASFLKDPLADLPTAAKFVNTFKKDYVVNFTCGNTSLVVGGTNGGASGCTSASAVGRPNPDIALATGVYKAGCLGIVDPLAYQAPALGYPIIAVSNLEFYSSGNGVYTTGLRYLADELSSPTTVYGAGGITTVDKVGTAVGTTGFSSLGIADVFYSNTSIGIIPNCIN